jgi:hypothetical protein
MFKKLTFLTMALLYSAMTLAQGQEAEVATGGATLNLQMPEQEYMRLAAAMDTTAEGGAAGVESALAESEYKDRWFTGNKVHKYAGIGSIALAIVAGLAPKEYDGLHEQAAEGALALGVVAVGTGLAFHYEDLSTSNFTSNPDNTHALLTTLGVLGYALAVDKGGEGGHAGAGIAGAALMLYGIKMTW